MASVVYRIKVTIDEGAPFPFRWQLYAPASDKPFLNSKRNFRTDKAAARDALEFLARSNKRGMIER